MRSENDVSMTPTSFFTFALLYDTSFFLIFLDSKSGDWLSYKTSFESFNGYAAPLVLKSHQTDRMACGKIKTLCVFDFE